MDEGRHGEAIAALRASAAAEPSGFTSWGRLAQCHLAIGEPAAALDICERARGARRRAGARRSAGGARAARGRAERICARLRRGRRRRIGAGGGAAPPQPRLRRRAAAGILRGAAGDAALRRSAPRLPGARL
nr:tetratricopeptide repeat protein [Methylosinus trichosporium]